MSTTTRPVRKRSATSTEREQYLPVDLLLEIVARSDVTTVVRCTAVSSILRRGILDPAFRTLPAADGGGFDPALLLGVSYRTLVERINGGVDSAHRVIHTPSSTSTQPRIRLDACGRRDLFLPVASRDGLLLSRGYNPDVEMRVCDTLTGHATPLPRIAMAYTYGHVFLAVGDAGESYELLVADIRMRFQTFSSKHDQWGAIRRVSVTAHDAEAYRPAAPCPAVVRRTVYSVCWDRILAMDADTAEGTVMELPPGCLSRMMTANKNTNLLLASACGSLSLLVMERDGISMWTLTPASPPLSTTTWIRQLVIHKVEIEKMVGLAVYARLNFVLECFGETSGVVILRVGNGELLRLDLGTKLVKRLHNEGDVSINGLFLHETDRATALSLFFSE